MIVYWAKAQHHTNILKEGYVGVTNNLERRIKDHNKYTNKHLQNALQKYNVIFTIVVKSSNNICIAIEKFLRPVPNIGWNICAGGGLPPSTKGKKLLYRKRSVPAWNKGKKCPQISKALKGRCNPHSELHKLNLRKPKANKINYQGSKSSSHRENMRRRAIENKDHLKFGPKKLCFYCTKMIDPGNFAKFHGEKCRMKGEILQ